MKKPLNSILITIIISLVICNSGLIYANTDDAPFPDGYHIVENNEGDTVYFGDIGIEEIDVSTFETIWFGGMEYGYDKNNVYYYTRIMKGLEPDQFQIKTYDDGSFVFLYDDDTIYLGGMDITDSQKDTIYRNIYLEGLSRDEIEDWVNIATGKKKVDPSILEDNPIIIK